jgi:protein involved in polysaccharide export with SLBB domain
LAEEIKTNLETDYFYHATVVLGIDMIHNKRVGRAYVTGQVRSPGPVDIAEDEKLMASDAILHAGGFSEYADRRRVKIMRPMESSSGVTNLYVDVMAVWQQGKRDKDVELKPGDRIYVSSKLINF